MIPRAERGRVPRAGAATLTAARDVTELPALVGVRGETPGAGLPIRVTAVIPLQVLAGESERARRSLMAREQCSPRQPTDYWNDTEKISRALREDDTQIRGALHIFLK